jgi:hypothetical protein
MSTNKMLEKLELYNSKVIKELQHGNGFNCMCRFSHIFDYTNIDEWCISCKEPKFQQELINEINNELKELDSPFHIYYVNEYGIGEIICRDNHIYKYDIDEIPNECVICNSEDCSIRQAEHDSNVWKRIDHNNDYDKISVLYTDSDEESSWEITSDYSNNDDTSEELEIEIDDDLSSLFGGMLVEKSDNDEIDEKSDNDEIDEKSDNDEIDEKSDNDEIDKEKNALTKLFDDIETFEINDTIVTTKSYTLIKHRINNLPEIFNMPKKSYLININENKHIRDALAFISEVAELKEKIGI